MTQVAQSTQPIATPPATVSEPAPVQSAPPVPAAQVSSPSQRFTEAVEREFTTNAGAVQITSYQRKLIQNYFIKLDMVLRDAEVRRQSTAERYRDQVPVTWGNVNMQKLATDAIAYSGVGLDPSQENQINIIPYKNNKTNKYDIGFIIGYRGQEVKARKYGLDIPDDVVVELVYSNDRFTQFKKDMNNKIESYVFEVVDNFNRGEIVGGFYYHKFFDHPEKNKLRVFSKADIMKRKPKNASAEFWGGEKDKYDNGQKVGKEQVEGWLDEMAYKTIFKAAFRAITIDSEKIDQHFLEVIKREQEALDNEVVRQINEHANGASDKGKALGFEDDTAPDSELPKNEISGNQIPSESNQQSAPTGTEGAKKKSPF